MKRRSDISILVLQLLLVVGFASPVRGQEVACGLSAPVTHLARILYESDFGHSHYRQAATPPDVQMWEGTGYWLAFEADEKPVLVVLLAPRESAECKLATQSFCVSYVVDAAPDDDNMIEPLVGNVVELLRRKDHGEFAPPSTKCGWVYLAQEEAPEAALSSAGLERTAHWWGLLLWFGLTLLGGVWLRRRRASGREGQCPQRDDWLWLAVAGLLLWALAFFFWEFAIFSLLWLDLWTLTALLAWQARAERRLWWPLAAVGLVALALRIHAPHLPANWYVAVQVPDSLPVADVVGGGGFAGLFRCLGFVFPVGSTWVFGWNILASSATAVLFAWAGYRAIHADGERRWPGWLPLAWGLLLALDPLMVRIGASDATHVTALFAGAVAAAAYVEATRANDFRWWAGALLAAVLMGWTRLEFAAFPLVLPLLFGTGRGRIGRRTIWTGGFIGFAAAAALASLASRSIHAEMTQVGTFQWTFEHVSSWFRILTLQFLREHHLNQALYLLFVPFVVWVCWTRRWSRLGLIPAFYLLVAPRIVSAFHEPEIAWNLLIARYDLAIIAVMWLWAAAGLYGMWTALVSGLLPLLTRMAGREKLARYGLAGLALGGAVAILAGGQPARDISAHRYPFQYEYEFLQERLAEIEQGTVVTVWQQGDRTEGHDFDTALAQPHPLLVMDNPEVRWVVVNEFNALPAEVDEAFFFPGANTQLDAVALLELGGPDVARSALKLRQLADGLMSPDTPPLASEEHRPVVLQLPMENGELHLNWYRWIAPR